MPSRSNDLASVPPDIVYGTGSAASSSARSAAAIASTSGPSKSVSTAWSRCTHSRTMPEPISASTCRSNSSSWPGRNRPSMTAEPAPGITFDL
jgi:hypothetical protein